MHLEFDTKGNEKQKEAARYWLDDSVTDILYGGGKGGGKSFLGCNLIFGDAFIYPNTRYFIARQELNDLRKHTLPSIYEVFDIWKIPSKKYRFDGKDNFFELDNRSIVMLLECAYLPRDPKFQRLGSIQVTRGWFEESGEINESAFSNLSAAAGRWKNKAYGLERKILQTCNPSKNYLYRRYYKKWKDGTLDHWKRFIQALPTDNPMLPEGYVQHLLRTFSKSEIERLVYGNWEYDDDPAALLDFNRITDIFTNSFVEGGPYYITVDVARFGADSLLIRVWCGWRVVLRVEEKGKKVTESADIVKGLAIRFAVPMSQVIADEDGVGGGVVDLLSCVGFVANSSPLETGVYDDQGNDTGTNFDNLKSQCGFKLADKINAAQVYDPSDGEVQEKIIEELEQLKQKAMDKDQKKGLMPKDKIKELISRSPDDLDTFIMRAYFEINAPSSGPVLTFVR